MMTVYFLYFSMILATITLNVIAQRYWKSRWPSWLGFGIPYLFIIAFMLVSSSPRYLFEDFNKSYYTGGRLVFENSHLLYTNEVAFANIPIFGFLFTPFALLPRLVSYILLAIISTLAVGLTCYLLARPAYLTLMQRVVIVGLFVISGPIYNSLRQGNSTHLVFPLLLGGLLCIQRQRRFLAGLLLGIAALTKIPLMLFGVYYLVRREWQVIAGFVVAVVVIVAASLLIFGFHLHVEWFNFCILPFLSGKVVVDYNNQSLDAFLGRLLSDHSLLDWGHVQLGTSYRLMRYAIVSLLVSFTIWVFWKTRPPATDEDQNLEFSVILCLALILSSISWIHYYLYLLIPLSLLVSDRLYIPQGRYWVGLIGITVLLLSLPPIVFNSNNMVIRLLVSHYFLGGLMLLAILLVTRWQSSQRLLSTYVNTRRIGSGKV